jgi:hypothetical protein
MFQSFFGGEAIKVATYLINCMPLRILDNKSPAQLLLNLNDFTISLKVFGCVCFVHDYRNSVGKLDPRAIKCVFVGYSPTQKGYRCWCPSEHHFFVSMDVSFREHEPYYGQSSDNEITPFSPEVRQEGESNSEGILVVPFLFPLQVLLTMITLVQVRGRKITTLMIETYKMMYLQKI